MIDKYDFLLFKYEVNRFGCFLKLKNKTTAVTISYEPMEGNVIYITIAKIIDHNFPDFTDTDSFDFGDILLLNSKKDINIVFEDPFYPDLEKVDDYLSKYAKLLKKHGHSVLVGDFSVLKKVRKLVDARK